MIRHLFLLTVFLIANVHGFAPRITTTRRSSTGGLFQQQQPFGIVVQAEIDPDRMGEFIELIQSNAQNSRLEPGCRRFDVWRSDNSDNVFFFCELYDDMKAVEYHKTQPHYQKWADFKASGGTLSSTTHKMHGEFVGP